MYYYPNFYNVQGQPYYIPSSHHSNMSRNYFSYPAQQYFYQPSQQYYRQQYPDVDPTLFNESAVSMQNLMKEASLVLNQLAESKSFAKKVMTAAQKSDIEELERLIKSTGIKSKVDTSVNPDGINLKLISKIHGADCCNLTIALRWRT